MHLKTSPCGHFFQHEDGSPFFYLADTAWLLFNKLKEEEIRKLFADRANKGFTVIQSVVFRDLFEPNTPNAYGVPPFASEEDMYAVRMNPEWIAYVKRITAIAEEYNLVMGLLPTWGDKWNEHSNSAGPVIMDVDSARDYGRFLSDELAEQDNVIWVLGGDSPIRSQDEANIIRAMAEGIRSGGSKERLVTFHPSGLGSSEIFHAEPWLDFNAIQSSHYKPNIPDYLYIERLYNAGLSKPCLNMEPNYEKAPMFIMKGQLRGQPNEPIFSDYDVRKTLYRSVLAGGAGYTYGCEPIRQVYREGDRIHVFGGYPMPTWEEGLAAPGSAQLNFLVNLLKERSYFTRVPAQECLLPHRTHGAWPDRAATGIPFAGQENTDPVAHIRVARCREGGYLMAYLPVRQVLQLDTSILNGERFTLMEFDPQNCACIREVAFENTGTITTVPQRDTDTFYILDAV